MATLADLRQANPMWFGRGNRRFFRDKRYKVINYRGKVYLAQETCGMSGGSNPYWKLRPIGADLKIQAPVEQTFPSFEGCREWVQDHDMSGRPVPEARTSARTGVPKHSWAKLVHSGMGGFLNPPGHPEHEWSIKSVYGDTSSMSLSYAAKHCGDPKAKAAAKAKLSEWRRPPLSDPRVQDWIHQVLGYFAGMYVGMDKAMQPSWDVSDLRHLPDADPVLNQEIHAGVHLIRQYYPEYKAIRPDFQAAYWGRRPSTVVAAAPQGRPVIGPPRLTR